MCFHLAPPGGQSRNRTWLIFNSDEPHLRGYQYTKFEVEILRRSRVRALTSNSRTDARTHGRTDAADHDNTPQPRGKKRCVEDDN